MAAATGHSLAVTVLPTHEPESLRQFVGEGRQLVSAMGEVLDRTQLLRRGGCDGFGFLSRRLGGAAGLTERLGDAGGELGALATHIGDTLARARRFRRGFRDAVEVFYPIGGVLYHLTEIAADALEQRRGAIERASRVLHRFADVARLAPTFLGELVHFVGDDGEAAAVHAGARGFDRGVEREQVRLVRHESDRLGELLYLRRDVAQTSDFGGALLGGGPEVGQLAHGAL